MCGSKQGYKQEANYRSDTLLYLGGSWDLELNGTGLITLLGPFY